MSKQPVVTVVGSTMVDLISYLERMPERGETIFGRSFAQGFGGKGANQAVMAAILGARVAMVNCVADDTFGPATVENFRSFGVDVGHVGVVAGSYSGVANVLVEPTGDNRIVLGAGANEAVGPELVDAAFDALPRPDIVVSQLEIPQPPILRGFQRAKAVGAITVLNPGPAAPVDPDILELTDWLVPNETECALLTRELLGTAPADEAEMVKALGDGLGVPLVTTLGERGAMLYRPGVDAEVSHLQPPVVEAVDTTGAGDAFVGAFVYAIARELEAMDAVRFANTLAADSVTRPGTQISFAQGDELERLLAETALAPASA